MTREEALEIASEYGLEFEVETMIDAGLTPEEALLEWDLV